MSADGHLDFNFDSTGGSHPGSELALGTDGNFYSTTNKGGAQNKGTIYQMTPAGVLKTILSFDGVNGSYPDAPLALGIDGNLYGTTTAGGTTSTGLPAGGGQIYRLRFGPKLTTREATRVLTTSACPAGEIDPGDVESWMDASGTEVVTPINSEWERVAIEDGPGRSNRKRFGRLKFSASP